MKPLEALAAALATNRFSFKTLADGSGVIIDTRRMRVLSLNLTGMFLLEQIAEGVVEEARLCRRLTESFEVDGETADRDLRELVGRLEQHLLEDTE